MERHSLATLGLIAWTTLLAGPAAAQIGPYRRFVEQPVAPNRPNRIIYVPLLWSFPGPPPLEQPHDTSAAVWGRLPVGSRNARPSQVLDRGVYVLEEFAAVGPPDGPRLRAVITRRPAPPDDAGLPELRVVAPDSWFMRRALPRAQRLGPPDDGVRYVFELDPPDRVPGVSPGPVPFAERAYAVTLNPARPVPRPPFLARAPTFGGVEPELRLPLPPPRTRLEDRVAGKRIERRERGERDRR